MAEENKNRAEKESINTVKTISQATDSENKKEYPPDTNAMFGFPKSLCSAVFGILALISAYAAVIYVTGVDLMAYKSAFKEIYFPILLSLFVSSAIFCVPAIIMSFQSIICYQERVLSKNAKPVLTLVCGIAGAVFSAAAAVMFIYVLAMTSYIFLIS